MIPPRAARHGPWEAWALGATGLVVVLAWGLFGWQGVVWVIAAPILVLTLWIGSWTRTRGYDDEIEADFERMRLERIERQKRRDGR